MKKVNPRDIEFDFSLRVIPEVLLCDYSKPSLFDQEKWYSDVMHWLEYILSQDGFFYPEIILKAKKLRLGLQFTDDATIYQLNDKWMQKKETTDVLSFPLIDGSNIFPSYEYVELGDIVISVATAYRQSKEYEHDLERELRWLTSHGLLHLLGWDHQDEKSLQRMLKVQERLLEINVNL